MAYGHEVELGEERGGERVEVLDYGVVEGGAGEAEEV